MADDWIMEVLCDLRAFARKNGMPRLASELDQTVAVAALELGPGLEKADRSGAGEETMRALRNEGG